MACVLSFGMKDIYSPASVEDAGGADSCVAPLVVKVPFTAELPATAFKADASYVQYHFKEGQKFPTRVAGSRPTRALKMPWFKDYRARDMDCGEMDAFCYREWLLGNIAARGCYVLEPYCPASLRVHAALDRIRGDFRVWQSSKLHTGLIADAEIAEGMNLCPLYDDNVEALPVQEFIISVEHHLESIGSPSTSSVRTPHEPNRKREAMFISYRTRGMGSGESYLNHWHTDFDAYDAGKRAYNRGEEVLEEFLVKHLPFIALQLCKKFEKQGVRVANFPTDSECRRMNRLPMGQIDKEKLCVPELASILQEYEQDVNNIWFTLRTEQRPCSGLCLQTSPILADEDHDYRVMDEFVDDEVPALLETDMITGVPNDGEEVTVVFGSMRYTHRSCKFLYPDGSVAVQRRNNMEARFLLLNEGGLQAIAGWMAKVKHCYL